MLLHVNSCNLSGYFTHPKNREVVLSVKLLGFSETHFKLKTVDTNYMRPFWLYLMGVFSIVSAVT